MLHKAKKKVFSSSRGKEFINSTMHTHKQNTLGKKNERTEPKNGKWRKNFFLWVNWEKSVRIEDLTEKFTVICWRVVIARSTYLPTLLFLRTFYCFVLSFEYSKERDVDHAVFNLLYENMFREHRPEHGKTVYVRMRIIRIKWIKKIETCVYNSINWEWINHFDWVKANETGQKLMERKNDENERNMKLFGKSLMLLFSFLSLSHFIFSKRMKLECK